jgi:putative membrane protein insertion efficiency factor
MPLPRRLALAPIRFYQRRISPGLPRRCKYEPTCSAYAVQAIRELGVIRGAIVAAWRLLRCNPFSHGGVDDVADRRLFRDRNAHAPSCAHDHPTVSA